MVGRFEYKELERSTLVTFKRELTKIGVDYKLFKLNETKMEGRWFNGSTTVFTNFDDESKFGSVEMSTIFVDEGAEVPSSVYRILFPSRLRWHLPDCTFAEDVEAIVLMGEDPESVTCECPRRAWVCTNPLPSDYLEQAVEGKIDGWECFAATPGENPYNGPDYMRDMVRKAKTYGPAWFDTFINGKWGAFEGARFPMFDDQKHVIPDETL